MKKHPILFFFLILSALFFFFILIIVVVALSGTGAFHREPIAIFKIEGTILESLDIVRDLEELRLNKSVKAVVLRLDSPGGSVAASQEIFKQVLSLKKDKKVIVSMGTVAASGAYYIACAADKIVANAGSITGSIGVIMENFGIKHLVEKIDIQPRTIKSGRYKDVGSPFRDMTEEDRIYLQNILDNMYEQFLRDVAENRKIPLEKMRRIAEGKVYTGLQAHEIGLIDSMGNIYDAIELAKTEAKLPKDAKVRWPKEPTTIEKILYGDKSTSLLHTFLHKFGKSYLPLWLLDNNSFNVN